MGEIIHWEGIEALYAAADSFIEAKQERIKFHKEQQSVYEEAMQTGAAVLSINGLVDEGMTELEAWRENERETVRREAQHRLQLLEAERSVDEVMAFRDALHDVELPGGGGLNALLTDRARAWLRLGLQAVRDAEKERIGKMGITPDEIENTKRAADYNLPFDDRKRAIWQHLQQIALADRGIAFLQNNAPIIEQAEEPDAGRAGESAAECQFIGWVGETEQLKQLADELQKEKFIPDVEAFKCQFKDAESITEGPCQWLKTDRSLAHLLEKLLNKRMIPGETNIVKEAKAHFLKKNGSKFSNSLTQNRTYAKGDTKSRGFETIDQIISRVFP
jgi:hypothetical protein